MGFSRPLLLAAGLFTAGFAHGQDIDYQTVATTGDAAPNLEFGVLYDTVNDQPWFTEGSFDIPGRGLIRSTIVGPPITGVNDVGLWEGPSDALVLLARTGNAAPGTKPNVVYTEFDALYRNSSGGRAAFGATLGGAVTQGVDDTGIWFRPTNVTQPVLIAQAGESMPQMPGRSFGSLAPDGNNRYNISDVTGTIFLRAPSNDATPVIGLFGGTVGDFTNIAFEGGQAPGVSPGVVYDDCPVLENFEFVNDARSGLPLLQFNQQARLAYRGTLRGGSVGENNDTGVWTGIYAGSLKAIALFAREGDTAASSTPNIPLSGVSYGNFPDDTFRYPILSPGGRVSMIASLNGTGVSQLNRTGIWAGPAADVPTLIVRAGTQAPGTANGVLYNDFLQYDAADSEWLLFMTRLVGNGVTGGNDEALYVGRGSIFTLVARENSPAPGTGSVFESFEQRDPTTRSRIQVNSSGFVAFSANVKGANVNTNNDEGLWAGTVNNIRLIAREGDAVPGTQPGTTYGPDFFDTFQLNEANEIVFDGVATTANNDVPAILALNSAGQVILVGAVGGQLPKNDTGSFGTIQSFNVNPLEDPYISIDNNGGIGFPVQFQDGDSAVLVANLRRTQPPAAQPSFSPTPGSFAEAVNVSLSTTTPEARIRYTTDGTTPNSTSTLYNGPFSVTVNTTVQAFAFRDGFENSPIVSGTYTLEIPPQSVDATTISPGGGTFSQAVVVTISTPTPNATIRFTIDGSDPAVNGGLYTGPFTLNNTAIVRSFATRTDFAPSSQTSATFAFTTVNNLPKPADVDLSGKRRTKTDKRRVVLRGSAESADGIGRVEYTINGGKPQKARGGSKWRIPIRIKPDKNSRKEKLKIEIIAYTNLNVPSETAIAIIIYKPKRR